MQLLMANAQKSLYLIIAQIIEEAIRKNANQFNLILKIIIKLIHPQNVFIHPKDASSKQKNVLKPQQN